MTSPLSTTAEQPSDAVGGEFEPDLAAAARRLQASMVQALQAGHARIDDPTGIAKSLNCDKTMAWKLSRIARSPDPIAAVAHVPGVEGLELVLEATERAGVGAAVVEDLRMAIDQWRRLIDRHAGDKATFRLLLAGVGGEHDPGWLERHRKLLYQGSSVTWGVHADAILRVDILGPGARDDLLDVVTIRGLVGFFRLRPTTSWIISNVHILQADAPQAPIALAPLDSDVAPGEAPLLRAFCSQPVPQVQRLRIAGQYVQDVIAGESCGRTKSLDCLMGEVFRGGARYSDADGRGAEQISWQRIRTPVKVLNLDVVVHRSLAPTALPFVRMRSELQGELVARVGPDHPSWLPIHEQVVDFTSGPMHAPVPEFGRYPALLESAFRRMGWSPEEFRLFRLRMRFPPISTIIGVGWPTPQRLAMDEQS